MLSIALPHLKDSADIEDVYVTIPVNFVSVFVETLELPSLCWDVNFQVPSPWPLGKLQHRKQGEEREKGGRDSKIVPRHKNVKDCHYFSFFSLQLSCRKAPHTTTLVVNN